MIVQEMSTVIIDPFTGQSTTIQKGIREVLVERGLLPQGGVRLKCEKPKCTNCQTLKTCCMFVQGQKCNSCKETRQNSGKYTKQQICDVYNLRKKKCQ